MREGIKRVRNKREEYNDNDHDEVDDGRHALE